MGKRIREDGYYWVIWEGLPYVAEYLKGEGWMMPGHSCQENVIDDEDLDWIADSQIPEDFYLPTPAEITAKGWDR